MNRFLLLLSFSLISTTLFGQADCDCRLNLDSASRRLERDYPGFPFKNTQGPEYSSFLRKVRLEAERPQSAKSCHGLIQRWLQWFGDGHLGVSYSGDVFKPKKVKSQQTPVWENLNESRARKLVDSLETKDSLIGIWESYESFYKVLIWKNKGESIYRAYLLETINQNWKAGEVKMEFFLNGTGKWKCRFYTSDHSPEEPEFRLDRNLLEIDKITVWNRLHPAMADPIPVESFVSSKYKWTQEFRVWDQQTFYIQFQNLNVGIKPLVDSLFRTHRGEIRSRPFLIVDLRDNEGGDLTAFESLWPYVLDKPSVLFGTRFYCTAGNLEAYRRQIENLQDQLDPGFEDLLKDMENHRGGWLEIPNDTLRPDSVLTLPSKVVLLVNQKCKSSVEDFLLTARNSQKVIVAGTPTGGVVDFEETVDVPLPDPSLILFHPIGISNRLPGQPLDGKGISPDWLLEDKERAWQPWVRQVLRRLKKEER